METSFLSIDDGSFERIWNSIATDANPDSFPKTLEETPETEWRPLRERWALVMREIHLRGTPVGYIFISPKKDGSAHLGYGLYAEYRKKGLMPKLARIFLQSELPLLPPEISVILASVLPENTASQRTLRSLGFSLIGEIIQEKHTYLRYSRPRETLSSL